MPKHIPAPAIRAALSATTMAVAALAAVLPATAPTAAPAPAAVQVAHLSPVTPIAWSTPTSATASSRLAAMNDALSKIGSPYRWGAAGPNAFDCSGLVSWAFKNNGISLPRTSRAMSTVGTPVARADLRPGDLVFFYRPVSHVGIYIGAGKIVHASTSRSPVKISDISRMPFHSARRV